MLNLLNSKFAIRIFVGYVKLTRMTTFIKTKFNISDDQTNIVKYRLAPNITEYHIKKIILQRIIITKVPSKRKKIFKSVHKQRYWTFVVQRVI